MFIVYILKSREYNKTYVGSTNDLRRRLAEHNKGYSTFSKRYAPWEILYKEEYNTEVEARQREKYLKSRSGRRFLKKLF